MHIATTVKKTTFSIIYINYGDIRCELELSGTNQQDVISRIKDCKEVKFCAPTMEGALGEITPSHVKNRPLLTNLLPL